MRTFTLDFSLLALAVACLLNIVINNGCVTKHADDLANFKLEGVDRAAGKVYDTPLVY